MIHLYKSSKKAIIGLVIAFGFVLLFASFLSLGSGSTPQNSFKWMGILLILFALVVFGVSLSKIEIDDEARTISLRNNYRAYGPVPIDKIIRVGRPQQNYVAKSINSFVYILYDDPSHPGEDAYLKIPDIQFGPQTISQVVRKLKELNGDIELDAQLPTRE